MTTFSELIDRVMLETNRPDMRNEFVSYLNQAIRECHFDPETGGVVFLRANRKETQIEALSETSLTWQIPQISRFQGLEAVRYDNVWVDDREVYARELAPGRRFGIESHCWYQVDDTIAFKGFGGLGSLVSLSWFEYPPSLIYYEEADRPAIFSELHGFLYNEPWIAAEEGNDAQAHARFLTSNWLLLRWSSVLEEGLRAKVYKRLADRERATTSYSLFMKLRRGLITSESARMGFS